MAKKSAKNTGKDPKAASRIQSHDDEPETKTGSRTRGKSGASKGKR